MIIQKFDYPVIDQSYIESMLKAVCKCSTCFDNNYLFAGFPAIIFSSWRRKQSFCPIVASPKYIALEDEDIMFCFDEVVATKGRLCFSNFSVLQASSAMNST